MTEWTKIYTDVTISGSDKFTFVTLRHITWPEKEAKELMQQFIPTEKHDDAFTMARATADPLSIIRMYLCKTMSSTFCISRGDRDRHSMFYIGARRPQDIFKLILKIPSVKKTCTWDSRMLFSVRVAEGDDYDPEKFKLGNRPRGWAI